MVAVVAGVDVRAHARTEPLCPRAREAGLTGVALCLCLACPQPASPVFTSDWETIVKNLYDPTVDEEESEIRSILLPEGQEQRERQEAIAKRRQWMAVVAQRDAASAEWLAMDPRIRFTATSENTPPGPEGGVADMLPRPRPTRVRTAAVAARTAADASFTAGSASVPETARGAPSP